MVVAPLPPRVRSPFLGVLLDIDVGASTNTRGRVVLRPEVAGDSSRGRVQVITRAEVVAPVQLTEAAEPEGALVENAARRLPKAGARAAGVVRVGVTAVAEMVPIKAVKGARVKGVVS